MAGRDCNTPGPPGDEHSRDQRDPPPLPTDRAGTAWVPIPRAPADATVTGAPKPAGEVLADGVRAGEVVERELQARKIRMIRPERWRHYRSRHNPDLANIECPYCLTLCANYKSGDEHLWRIHADNTAERAGLMSLIPWLRDLDQRLLALERELVTVETGGLIWREPGIPERHETMTRRQQRGRWRRLWRDTRADQAQQ